MTKPDGEFLRSLTESQGSVQVAADWLRSLGYEVRVTPLRVRPDASQITAYQDDGDLSVCIAGNWEIVEVKEIVFAPLRELARDPSRTIIIDNAASFERNNDRRRQDQRSSGVEMEHGVHRSRSTDQDRDPRSHE